MSSANAATLPTPMSVTPSRERILVVDDEPTIRSLVAQLLDDEGFEVSRAADGAEALQVIAKSDRFDLVILDMWMPVMNGWEFADALREQSQETPMRIVVMTAATEARARAAELGAIGYIGKPFDVDDLVRVVREALPPHPHAA